MGKSFDTAGFKKLLSQLEKTKGEVEAFKEDCAKELAKGLINKVKKRTLPGQYSNTVEFDANIPEKQVEFITKTGKAVSFKAKARTKHVKFTVKTGKTGGTLRRAWSVAPISKTSNITSIEVVNPMEYASWWEHGHRTANHKGWVQGKFVLKKASEEIEAAAPKIIQKKMDKWLGGNFK